MNDWTQRRLSSSPALELRRLDELAPSQQLAFAELRNDADFYGLLVPRVAGESVKSVSRQTAELFHSLAQPHAIDFPDDAWRNDVIDLVLDGILEIEDGDRFVCGADAYRVFFEAPLRCEDSLSREALLHASELMTRDVATLTTALYTYNRLPRTRAWAARFPNRDAVLEYLGANALLERVWVQSSANSGWISWRPRESRANGDGGATWKLYVSPRPEHVRDAFHALVRVLAERGGAPMKIGQDAAGLLRPDKLVAYFASRTELEAVANALSKELRDCPAHGVPFSAFLDAQGVLSWGADPPDSERVLSWLDRESWRLWVAKSLASALSIAKNATMSSITPAEFAIERVRRRGVDVATWAPTSALWSETRSDA